MFKEGDLVNVKVSFIGNEPQKGFVYETYPDFDDKEKTGASIILENGADLGGFSTSEQENYLEYIKSTGVEYEFTNVIQLANDYDKGVFKNAFL